MFLLVLVFSAWFLEYQFGYRVLKAGGKLLRELSGAVVQ